MAGPDDVEGISPAVETLELDDDDTTRADTQWPVPSPLLVGAPASSEEDVEPPAGADEVPAAAYVGPPVGPRAGRRRWVGLPREHPGVAGLLLLALLVAAVPWLLLRNGAATPSRDGAQTTPQAAGIAPSPPPPTTSTAEPGAKSKVAMPDVSGKTVAQAQRLLASAGLKPEVRKSESDGEPGRILEQSPDAKEKVVKGSTVVLLVSSGPARVDVPDVRGLSADAAARALGKAGLDPRIRLVASAKKPGLVLAQRPAAGESVDAGSTVSLEVAKARAKPVPVTIEVPRLTGLELDVATGQLRDLGLRREVTYVDSDQPRGTVLRQSPRAGAKVEKGAAVGLQVSNGPALVDVPDVTGLDVVAAREQLEAAGFDVIVNQVPTSDPSQDGIVLDQAPAGGNRARKGATVTLSVAMAG